MTWLPAWDEAAQAIVRDVLAAPVPAIEEAVPDGGIRSWRFAGDKRRHHARSAEEAQPFMADWWRRLRASELAEERGLPAVVRDLAWALMPYGSVPMRFGWHAQRAIDEGKTTEAQLEAWARRQLERFVAA